MALPALWPGGFAILAACWRLPSNVADYHAPDAVRTSAWSRAVRSFRPGARRLTSKPSVTLVLPAYNEQARIGPALDELFGYLNGTGTVRARRRPLGE